MRKQYHTRTVGDERHTWDVHRLLRLARGRQTETIPLSAITELDALWWYREVDDLPTPRSIAHHIRLMQEADLRWPILLCADGRLMDGMHRVLKALVEGHREIQAVRFDPTPEPDFVNADVDALPYPDEEI
ncbi:hypothetical protein [Celeribacter persicus]|nr:hypothetical protein [Celeribacter persicus]